MSQGSNAEGSSTKASTLSDIETDVFIVGAGVTGLGMTILLNDFGVKTCTVARHRSTAPAPRAHITNMRTMEIFRDMGLEKEISDASIPLKDLGSAWIGTSLTGLEIGRYSSYGGGDEQLTHFALSSPCKMESTPQNFMEEAMLKRARATRADIRFYTELVSIEQSEDGIQARVRERGGQVEYNVRARYVVGADGGRSAVAEILGFGFTGKPGLMSMLSSWLEVDLEKYTAYRPACLWWLMQAGNEYWVGSGLLLCVHPWNEWTLQRQYDPTQGEPDTSDEAIIEYARKAFGIEDPDLRFRVKRVTKWQVNHVVAMEYSKGRIFLAGDAAHRHPPTGGLGSNTSIQDSYNLAWKLALVLKGHASERLLDSYNQERQPVGKQAVDHAISTLYDHTLLAPLLGFERGKSREEGMASLQWLFSDVTEAVERRAKVEEVIKLGDKRSNALGLQLGQRYTNSGAVIDDGTPFRPHTRDPTLYYEPTTHPGAFLPHAWLEYEKRRVSTLDVLKYGKFGLIVGIGGTPWASAAVKVSEELGVELPVHPIGKRCIYDDVLNEWTDRREITDYGALLVRPDRYIGWRCYDRHPNPCQALRSALRSILGRDEPKVAS
ncbi:uncharacterized protein A1O9_12220 [Exophiala aquamarina CBS 119918]|uniref:FAD-binding domain-containing protein n=1 Tax=Exophiala aquamarina CBS 119918 TaxID=1182545 RepID=A0A072P7J1_9EURO|nr:uncharacterized protein A1O9_12220 [Exophiala aquamarina CBS 119918]KEF51585.1 hypothetical protein A1O9_12220 [Exophiala aquamarina CBS 119918]